MPYQLLAYEVQPGDSADQIINRYYGPVSQLRKAEIKDKIASLNPHLSSVTALPPGQLIMLATPKQYCAVPANFERIIEAEAAPGKHPWFHQLNDEWRSMDRAERDLAYHVSPYMAGAGAASLAMMNTTFRTNAPLVGEIASLYESYRSGDLSKGQYDYRRRVALRTLSEKLGPTQSLLYGGRPPGEVIRINRQSGVSSTATIDREMRRMTGLAKTASRGGIALSVVGLGVACHDIASAATRQEKNEILVQSGGSITSGLAYAVVSGVALLLIATPVGWVGALTIGLGGAIVSYGGGAVARKIYDRNGSQIDFVEKLGVDHVCSSASRNESYSATESIISGRATFMR
ncbi:LysM peptidoglycan-binding domain-containing protein [Marinimicrobium alkaliphilum]|uniref:LysM peptidoglycan-binding domain-containing protein n=1 Tax=Marinimicrobium alkaliphilum TaxID=2202654 RepID=UPI000DB94EBC|nr:LysM domain-containing protein [Marinimicrobium alkaliphilum]